MEAGVLKGVLQAIRQHGSREIRYQSMSQESPELMWRRASHACGHGGLRWRVQAYCHVDRKFRDFLLPRILNTRSPDASGQPAREDHLWNETFDVEIGPLPALMASQRSVVAKDFGMNNGRAKLKVRYAMPYYALKRRGLLGDAAKQSPRTQHIVVLIAMNSIRNSCPPAAVSSSSSTSSSFSGSGSSSSSASSSSVPHRLRGFTLG